MILNAVNLTVNFDYHTKQYKLPIILAIFYLFPPPRDALPSTIAPTDPSQFCVPSQFGSSGLPSANTPNPLPGHFYSGKSNEHLTQAAEPVNGGCVAGSGELGGS